MTDAAAAARVFPNWVLLEPYVFRGDGDGKSFPDDTVAPIRASGTTSLGADFRIAFSVADPPSISRLYAQLPGFPDPFKGNPLQVVATHRHLVLLGVFSEGVSRGSSVLNFFIFKADQNNPSSSSLRALPHCTQHRYEYEIRGDYRRRRRSSNASNATPRPRLLDSRSSGLWCGDNGEEFVVAELTLVIPTIGLTHTEGFADMCFLRSSFTDDQLGRRKWDTVRVPILSTTDDDLWKLARWITCDVITFQRWMCWIDNRQGILFWDVSHKLPAAAAVSFLWFPENTCSLNSNSGNGRLSVVDHGRLLKFVYVARRDGGPFCGPLKPGTGFTITCHTLVLGGSMEWKKDYTVTSEDLPDAFQQGLPMFPQVDIDRPELVHFLFVEFGKPYRKESVLSIDMIKKTVVSFDLYVDGDNPLQTEDTHFIMAQRFSLTPRPFLPCEFPRFCNLSRKRKGTE